MLAGLYCDLKLMDDAVQERRERRDDHPNEAHGGKTKEFECRLFDLIIIVRPWRERTLAWFNVRVRSDLAIGIVLSRKRDEEMLFEVMRICLSDEIVFNVAPAR